MPRGKNAKPVPPVHPHPLQPYASDDKAEWGGFINIRLSDEQKENFYLWADENPQTITASVDDMLGSGLKITLSYDAENQAYVCAVTGSLLADSPGVRFVTTSRNSTMQGVLALTVWKHFVLTGGEYGAYRPRTGEFMKFG